MGGLTGNGLIQLRLPRGHGLTRQVLNEVKAPGLEDSVAPGLHQPVDRRLKVLMPMPPPQLFEHRVVKALPPKLMRFTPRARTEDNCAQSKVAGSISRVISAPG